MALGVEFGVESGEEFGVEFADRRPALGPDVARQKNVVQNKITKARSEIIVISV